MIMLTERENNLFAEWSSKYGNDFVKDGLPCPEEYEKAKYKITFVLKEPNDFEGSDMDMRKWVYSDGALASTWNNITRWTQAVLECGEYREKITEDDRKHWLQKISFMNLKKTNGTSTSNPAVIEQFAKDDGGLILKQINIYKPDIIICCGIDLVADCLADYVFHYTDKWESNRCFYIKLEGKDKRTAVLNCYHPLNLGTNKTNEQLYKDIHNLTERSLLNI